MSAFERGKTYTRNQIQRTLGGGLQDYLPHSGGRVVAGCFSKDINPDAPTTILPGTGVEIERWAEVFASQAEPVPVFVKQRSNQWYCFGYFRCTSLDRDPDRIAEQLKRTKRSDITMILTLERDKTLGNRDASA